MALFACMGHIRPFAFVVMVLGLGVASCGGSTSHTSAPNDDQAGAAARAGAAGNAASGAFGSGGTSGSASGGGAVSGGQGGVTEVTSEPPPCTTEDGATGILIDPFPYPSPKVSCQALGQPGKLDSKCPSDPFVSCSLDDCVLDSPLPGCCRPDGSCGLLDQGRFSAEKSLGCISRNEWVANASWLGGGQVAVACTP